MASNFDELMSLPLPAVDITSDMIAPPRHGKPLPLAMFYCGSTRLYFARMVSLRLYDSTDSFPLSLSADVLGRDDSNAR